MPRTNTDQHFMNGVLISEITYEVGDKQIEAEESAEKLRQILAALRNWATDARSEGEWSGYTNAQVRTRLALLDDRFAKLARAIVYLIRYMGETD